MLNYLKALRSRLPHPPGCTQQPPHFGPDLDAAAEKAIREGRLSQNQVDIIRSRKRLTAKQLNDIGKEAGFRV